MFEFETTFESDLEDLDQIYSGSGVHLYKDVTFSFTLIDPIGNLIENDSQLISSPLINEVIFDILDTGRNIIYPSYKSGTTSRSITITEKENISIFGRYTPNFGVRATVTNKVQTSPFISEFFTYANTPAVTEYSVYDASGKSTYTYNLFWDFTNNNNLLENFSAKTYLNQDVLINWGDSLSETLTPDDTTSHEFIVDDNDIKLNQVILETNYSNNLNYVNIDKYDLYASTTSLDEIILPNSENQDIIKNQFYKETLNIRSFNNLYTFKIRPLNFEFDTPYYFKAVPYSSIGSGKAISFGPHIFKSFSTSGEEIQTSNQFQIAHGNSAMKLDFLTGEIITNELSIIDIIDRGSYNTVLYTTQISDVNNTVYSSELKIVDTNNSTIGSGISFLEYASSDNSKVTYFATGDESYIYLYVSGVEPTGIYKLYKTLI